jgi:hypothetical protein
MGTQSISSHVDQRRMFRVYLRSCPLKDASPDCMALRREVKLVLSDGRRISQERHEATIGVALLQVVEWQSGPNKNTHNY